MQILINIDENEYNRALKRKEKFSRDLSRFENIIANGTPLNEYCEQQCPCYPMESEDD